MLNATFLVSALLLPKQTFGCLKNIHFKIHFLVSILKLCAKLLQLCPTFCSSMDYSPPGSTVPGIFQARVLECVAISFSNAWKWKVQVKSLSRVQLFATPWTAAHQAPPSMGFSRQEYWSGVPLPSHYYMLWTSKHSEQILRNLWHM